MPQQQQQDSYAQHPDLLRDGDLTTDRISVNDTNPSIDTLPSCQKLSECLSERCKAIDEEPNIPGEDNAPTDGSEIYPEGGYGWLVLAGTFVIAFW